MAVSVKDAFINYEQGQKGVLRLEGFGIGLDRLDEEGVDTTFPLPLPLLEEAFRTCVTTWCEVGCCLFHGIWKYNQPHHVSITADLSLSCRFRSNAVR